MRMPSSPPKPMGPLRALLAFSMVALAGSSSFADPVFFNAAGTGASGSVQVNTFDELPGNALAFGAQGLINAAAALPAGTVTTTGPFTLYYQANVRLLGPGGAVIDTGSNVITAVAKFQETATVTAGQSTVTFNMAADQTGSYFNFYIHSGGAIGNNATGVGFANDTPATLIYSAAPVTTGPAGNFTNLTGPNSNGENLDQTNGSGSGTGQQTVRGFGGSQLTFNTTFINTNFFAGATLASLPSISFNANNNLPFTEASPSAQFVNLTGSGPGSTFAGYVTPVLGSVNGRNGRDVQFQADASSSFVVVPEPASVAMTLLGLGGVGMGRFAGRRRRAAQA